MRFDSFVLPGPLNALLFLFAATFILQGHLWAPKSTSFFLLLLISQEEGNLWSMKKWLERSQLSVFLSQM